MKNDASSAPWTTPCGEELIPLHRGFYEPSARQVARALLGHFLVRRQGDSIQGGVIVETEAYLVNDPASHGYRRQTNRNRAMYGPPGCAYVYFIYGNHYCFNAVCAPAGHAEAVLVRAIQPVWGEEPMQVRRGVANRLHLTSGPGRLCDALAIDGRHDHLDLCDSASEVYLAANPEWRRWRRRLGPVVRGRRIGLGKAQHALLRFFLEASPFVSRRLSRDRGQT